MILVGTSGWQYADWRGVLYPEGVPQRLWLERYADCFPTVESNAAFYRLPRRETFENWRDRTPPDFLVAVKASRYLTHIRRLKDPDEPVERLLQAAGGLGPKLGPILLQLPPTLPADAGLLARCLACFPREIRVAVEPRHPSWFTEEVAQALTERKAALCWADRRGRPVAPLWRTAEWAYVRFHEGIAQPWPRYGDAALRTWVKRLHGMAEAYVYFNNDLGGAAVHDARRFIRLVEHSPLGDGLVHPHTRP